MQNCGAKDNFKRSMATNFLSNAVAFSKRNHPLTPYTPQKTNCMIHELGGDNFYAIEKKQEDCYNCAT